MTNPPETPETASTTETGTVEWDRPSVSAGRAAAIAGVHPDTMRVYVDQGIIEGYRLPKGHRRVYRDALARHIAARRADLQARKKPPAAGAGGELAVGQ